MSRAITTTHTKEELMAALARDAMSHQKCKECKYYDPASETGACIYSFNNPDKCNVLVELLHLNP